MSASEFWENLKNLTLVLVVSVGRSNHQLNSIVLLFLTKCCICIHIGFTQTYVWLFCKMVTRQILFSKHWHNTFCQENIFTKSFEIIAKRFYISRHLVIVETCCVYWLKIEGNTFIIMLLYIIYNFICVIVYSMHVSTKFRARYQTE